MLNKAIKAEFKAAFHSFFNNKKKMVVVKKAEDLTRKKKLLSLLKKSIRQSQLIVSLTLCQKQGPNLPVKIRIELKAIIITNGRAK